MRDIRDMSDSVQLIEDKSSVSTAVLLPSARIGPNFTDGKTHDIVSNIFIFPCN